MLCSHPPCRWETLAAGRPRPRGAVPGNSPYSAPYSRRSASLISVAFTIIFSKVTQPLPETHVQELFESV